MSQELKPCPFCGGRAEFQKAETGDGEPAEYVTCTKCSTSTALCYPCMDGPRDHLARLWNTRAQAPAAEPQWQPIETLPDDTLAILYGAKRSEMVIGMRHSRDGWVIDTPSEWASMYTPKLWQPLPGVPAATASEKVR